MGVEDLGVVDEFASKEVELVESARGIDVEVVPVFTILAGLDGDAFAERAGVVDVVVMIFGLDGVVGGVARVEFVRLVLRAAL